MAPLPSCRVKAGWYPFQHVGLDYFGSIKVKRGRSLVKRYGCILTCLQSRAVHLEVAHSLDTDSFIQLLIRFLSRRGSPTDLYSDNGSNFVGAERELMMWTVNVDKHRVSSELLEKRIRWHFNPPHASHRGGVWERIIRSVRRIVTAVCGDQTLNDECLLTVLTEAERILNNWPIVPVVSEDSESAALTPNHLLLLRDNDGIIYIYFACLVSGLAPNIMLAG